MAIVVALTGGGLKSAVAAATLREGNKTVLLHVDYGQPAAKAQHRALQSLASSFPDARIVAVELPYVAGLGRQAATEDGTLTAGGADVQAAAPAGTAAPRGLMGVLMWVAAQCALRFGAQTITTGFAAGADSASPLLSFAEGQPGRLGELLQTFNMMVETTLPERSVLRAEAPLIDLSYPEVIKLGLRLTLPFESTWSCDVRSTTPCGSCPSCQARADAFADARFPDPLTAPAGA